jgi:hypothetical protein
LPSGRRISTLLEFRFRELILVLLREVHTEIPVADRAVWIYLERVPPEIFGVTPDLGLLSAQIRQAAEPDHAEAKHGFREQRPQHTGGPRAHDRADGAAQQHRETESREITVSVVGQLMPGVHDTDHGPSAIA